MFTEYEHRKKERTGIAAERVAGVVRSGTFGLDADATAAISIAVPRERGLGGTNNSSGRSRARCPRGLKHSAATPYVSELAARTRQ